MTDTTIRPNRWIQRAQPRPDAPVQVVCLPSAGAGPSMYSRWAAALGDRAEVVAVTLPGREGRMAEPACPDLHLLARRIAVPLLSTLDRPYVLFGHSMGALIAYTIARVLPEAGGPAPARLVMSAARPPDLPLPAAVATSSDKELVAGLRELGGMPDEILAEPDWLAMLLKPLRTDLVAVDAFQPLPGGPPSCAAALVAGVGDDHAPPAVVAGWRRFLTGPTPVYALPGNHFYLRQPDNVKALGDIVLGAPDRPHPRPWGGYAVEPFDGDPAALAALAAACPHAPAPPAPDPDRHLLRMAVRDGDQLIAYVECGEAGDDECHVWGLVHPAAARRGIGGLLLGECRAYAAALGRKALVTTLDGHKEPPPWVVARGFRPERSVGGRATWRLGMEG
ncbi:GNAT family N-acetyltransferase [Micromonospora sp. NPDC005298]|uniref:GNAT family N-acetyltransferase n=1 Tax=Micromonospora sp. NPDC005298 TaxID=3156873 RepID=UPI0033B69B7A